MAGAHSHYDMTSHNYFDACAPGLRGSEAPAATCGEATSARAGIAESTWAKGKKQEQLPGGDRAAPEFGGRRSANA